jgi:hypothetical protein
VLLTCFSWAPDAPTPHNLDDLLDFNDPHNNWSALVGISSMHPIGFELTTNFKRAMSPDL